LPVYIRSNINQAWVAGIPREYRDPAAAIDKFEIPLWQLELTGGKRAARKRAEAYAEYALTYAETLQDGLPVREAPDNTARRVYRLRIGQIIKILSREEGNPAISTTGEPLPGEWYRILTEDGSQGYCFSYRLKLFEHVLGAGTVAPAEAGEKPEDPDLEMVLSKTWSPDWYGTMVSSGKINLDDLGKQWRFSPGRDLGLAHLYFPGVDRTFSYTRILPEGNRRWSFEGAPLEMALRPDSSLEVRYNEPGGAAKTLHLVSLPVGVDDLVVQETERRNALFLNLYDRGPVFSSANYGTLSFLEGGRFAWTDYYLLDSHIIPPSVLGSGAVSMGLFLDASLESRYDGAFSLLFEGIGNPGAAVNFMYTLDDQGFRIEYAPPDNLDGTTIIRRAGVPLVIYFFKAESRPLEQPLSSR
jgi:hypothetical protein